MVAMKLHQDDVIVPGTNRGVAVFPGPACVARDKLSTAPSAMLLSRVVAAAIGLD